MAKGGLNSMDVSFYLNHAGAPWANVIPFSIEGCRWFHFKTLRRIAAGEELTFDYSVFLGEGAGESFPTTGGGGGGIF